MDMISIDKRTHSAGFPYWKRAGASKEIAVPSVRDGTSLGEKLIRCREAKRPSLARTIVLSALVCYNGRKRFFAGFYGRSPKGIRFVTGQSASEQHRRPFSQDRWWLESMSRTL